MRLLGQFQAVSLRILHLRRGEVSLEEDNLIVFGAVWVDESGIVRAME